jgi:hypothetical protein
MTNPKFTPPMSREAGGKSNIHDSGWLAKIVNAVKAGTPNAVKRLVVLYHGVPPKMQDINEPISARPSSAPVASADVPGADDLGRDVSGSPPIHPAFTRASKRIF